VHDPLKQAFRIKFLGLLIWHVDPEKRGDDDSCDWWGRYRPLNKREQAIAEAAENLESTLDNRPHWADDGNHSREHRDFQELKAAIREWRRRSPWRVPVRWHIWHWRLQFSWLLHFKRWAFSKCCRCGKGFTWGYAPCSSAWNGTGPRWFRGEEHTYHHDCSEPRSSGEAAAG